MDAFVLLVLVTLKGGGLPMVNFVKFPDIAACEERADQLSTVLVKGGYQVLERACVMGIQHFTPHRHRKSKGDKGKPRKAPPKYLYLVALSGERVLAMPRHDREACVREAKERAQKAAGQQGGVKVRYYCAVSDQALIDDRDYENMRRREARRRYQEHLQKQRMQQRQRMEPGGKTAPKRP